MRSVFFVLLLAAGVGFCKSFGVVGETFPVREMSFLDFIEMRLKQQSEEWRHLEINWKSQAEKSANRPHPVGLPRALLSRHYHYDPTVVLAQDILDEKGEVLFPKGTRVNGLERLPNYAPCWLFFNADDAAQLRWAHEAMHHCQNPKLILTGGAVRDAEDALNAVIYFDQSARLSVRFQLHAVPALITRDGNRLQISEIAIKENGDAI